VNRRAFLRGSSALGLAALVPGRELPAEIAAPGTSGTAVLMANGPTVHEALMSDITQRALEYAGMALQEAFDRFAREIIFNGTAIYGPSPIDFLRPVPFKVVP
jgi:hypothetical protein